METVTRFADRQAGSVSAVSTPGPEVARRLSVTASYLLSEDGRKASLLAGGDGHAVQQIALQVPANRLHLVSVDKQGVARLKLRPRFERDGDRGVVRIDAAPVYDAPPTIDELYRAAAKNHELESAYYAERVAQRSKRSDDDRARRESVAEAFLADKGQRAIAHPPPSPKRCYINHRPRSPAVRRRDRPGAREGCSAGGAPAFPSGPQSEGRAQSAGPSSTARAARREETVHRRLGCRERHRRTEGSPGTPACFPWTRLLKRSLTKSSPSMADLPLYTRDGAERLQRFLRESSGLVDAVDRLQRTLPFAAGTP